MHQLIKYKLLLLSILPKEIIKQFFQEELITEEVYLLLIDALTSRNLLSHVYNEKI